MKRKILLFSMIISCIGLFAQWKPMGDKIKTKWAQTIDVNSVLPEYPRPIMERQDWTNLNGLWEYAILPTGQSEPQKYDGKILVPFAVESSLSGVQKSLGKEKNLWYKRSFTIPTDWKNQTILLHFGAVDWKTEVYLNNVKVGSHTGGYTPFSFDITPFLTSDNQTLVVKVWDPTNESFQPVGKQSIRPEGIWYTPVSGIWQTVWLEPVNAKYISSIKTIPNIDTKKLSIDIATEKTTSADMVEVIVKNGSSTVAQVKKAVGEQLSIPISGVKLWSPESPFLYDLEVNLYDKGKLVDKVKSYAAMRKISTQKDKDGIVRLQLNNKDYFQFGPLDQGWWPDGLYTAPTDEALIYDIQKTKDFGFNMIRKHMKVEPARWYTHCDRIGMLVWQDMPSGDRASQLQFNQYFNGEELVRSAESETNFYKEWEEIIDCLVSYPSIVTWIPFNTAWGQFRTVETAEWTKTYDPSRLVNPAAGGNHFHTGDILDFFAYPVPILSMYDTQRATVLGGYGGIALAIDRHMWDPSKSWGYVGFRNSKEATDEYINYAEILKRLIKAGFSAAVYTQATDIEGEINGLMTYDREVVKLDEVRLRQVNQEVCNSLKK